jgi:hypothetical protein
MIFSQFTEKSKTYVSSVRFLEDYVSFDLKIPESWSIQQKAVKDIEVINTNKVSEGIRYLSLVCKNDAGEVNKTEMALDEIIKFNKEREEKERLFKTKVQELKSIFDNKDINALRGLKIGIDELESLLSGGTEEKNDEDDGKDESGEYADMVQTGENKRPKRNSKSQG